MEEIVVNAPETKTLRKAEIGDINVIVAIHQTAFQGFFLDRMGPRFLKIYYRTILDYDRSILLLHMDEKGEIDGFAAGFRDPERFYRHFRSYRRKMMLPILFALFRRPGLIFQIARNTSRVTSVTEPHGTQVELSSIGTNRPGTGAGSQLLVGFCEQAAQFGASEVRLTTDRDDNDGVVDFYLRHGFEIHGTEERHGRVLYVMTRKQP